METLIGSNYLLLTTQRKDGRQVSTPMWAAYNQVNSVFYMQTYAGSAKVKRIRNNAEVWLTPCDSRGRLEPTAIRVRAGAVVVEPQSTEGVRADQLLAQRYGLARRVIGLMLWLMRRSQKVYLVITVDSTIGGA